MSRCVFVNGNGIRCSNELGRTLAVTCPPGAHEFLFAAPPGIDAETSRVGPGIGGTRRSRAAQYGRPWIRQMEVDPAGVAQAVKLPAEEGLIHGIAAMSEPEFKSELVIHVGPVAEFTVLPLLYLSHLWPRQVHLHPKEWIRWVSNEPILIDARHIETMVIVVLFGTYY